MPNYLEPLFFSPFESEKLPQIFPHEHEENPFGHFTSLLHPGCRSVKDVRQQLLYSLGNFQFNQSEEGSLSQAELHSIPRFDFNLHCETTPDPEPFVDVESSERRGEIRRQQSTVPQILVDFMAALPRLPFLPHFQPDIQFLIESQKKPFPQKRKNF